MRQCDETKPTCEQCRASLRRCIYATTPTESAGAVQGSPSTGVPNLSDAKVARPAPVAHSLTSMEAVSDADLYRHFLEHTSKRSFPPRREIGDAHCQEMLRLSANSEQLAHAVLALSAACLCGDMVQEGQVDVTAVEAVLSTGLRHHTQSAEQMRLLVSSEQRMETTTNAAATLAACALLVPFATAFQHINHWIQANNNKNGGELLRDPFFLPLVTPRDTAALLRGFGPLLSMLAVQDVLPTYVQEEEGPGADDTAFVHPSRNLPLFSVITATSRRAFSQLRDRVLAVVAQTSDEFCLEAAFTVLDDIAHNQYPARRQRRSDADAAIGVDPAVDDDAALLAQIALPLQVNRLDRDPLNWTVFSFFQFVQRDFLNLVFPLLDRQQIHESEKAPTTRTGLMLTAAEAIALDIYAHWLVLLLPLDHEEWYIGNFPTLAMQGLIGRYGNSIQMATETEGEQRWWPRDMWETARRLSEWTDTRNDSRD
jgi:hypothetical protein